MQLKYYKMMTPAWLKRGKHGVRFSTEVEWNDVEMYIPADTRFNESIFQVLLVKKDELNREKPYTVRIVAGLEFRPGESYAGGSAIGRLDERLSVVEQRVAVVEQRLNQPPPPVVRPRDPMCIMISGKQRAHGFEIRDPSGYRTRGPYRGVEGVPGARGLFDTRYLPMGDVDTEFREGVLAPTITSERWPQVFRMEISGQPSDDPEAQSWGAISSDVDGGHAASINYSAALDPSSGLRFTVFRGERNEFYRINYFEVSVYQ